MNQAQKKRFQRSFLELKRSQNTVIILRLEIDIWSSFDWVKKAIGSMSTLSSFKEKKKKSLARIKGKSLRA